MTVRHYRRMAQRRWWLGLGVAVVAVLGFHASPGESGVLDASWIAPTTNTDGTRLTDLAAYRVYYGTSGAPCPGGTFVQVPSATASPASNQAVSVRLTNLTTGSVYTVSVAAVDTAGNQSTCSAPASATAQLDFSVTPAAAVNFGSVNVGSSTTQAFTVQNIRSGSVTLTASVSAPFSIVGSTSFTLSGNGATQIVTVRFTPTTTATATANVVFRADGDTISRVVTGAGVAATDTAAPVLTITSPTSSPTLTTSNVFVTLGGTASDNVAVTQVNWSNSRGGSGVATGTTTWTAGPISLQSGQNVITVTARDASSNTAAKTLTITLNPVSFVFTDDPLVAKATSIKTIHFTELRAAIDRARLARGLSAFGWTDATLTAGVTAVKTIHLAELRTALTQAYQAVGRTAPAFTDTTMVPGQTPIKAVHLNEIRAALKSL